MKQVPCSYRLAGLSSMQRSASTCKENLKYVVIDSQRGEENQQWILQNCQNGNSNNFQPIFLAEIYPAKSINSHQPNTGVSSFSNLFSRRASLFKEQPLDKEIAQSQREVEQLERECRLLEKIINDMAEEQARLMVQIRIKERRKAVGSEKDKREKIPCPIHHTKEPNNTSASQTAILQDPQQKGRVELSQLKIVQKVNKKWQPKSRETFGSIKKKKGKENRILKSRSKSLISAKSQRKQNN